MIVDISRFRDISRRTQAGLVALLLAFTALVPVIISRQALAAPALTNRTLTTTSAVPADTGVTLTWSLTTPTSGTYDYIEIEFCDSPLGTCTNNGATQSNTEGIPVVPTPTAVLSGFTTGTNSATLENGAGGGTNNQIQIDKTTVDAASTLSGATIAIGGFTNDEEANQSYYTRVRVYSDAGTTLVFEGVYAQSTSQTLTVNARVQERLDFCVGSTAVNDATTTPGDCAAITAAGGTVDVGNVESGTVNVSPVDTVNGGSDTNGVALIRTNAVNGASIAYRALGETSSGALKVPGAQCSDGVTPPVAVSTVATDQCFNTSSTMGVFTANTERFGMVVAGINCSASNAYACSMAGDDYNLRRQTNYDGNQTATTFITENNQLTPTTAQYAWDANPVNTTTIASSTGVTPTGFKVIDNEALILKFAATAGVTTPTGAYSVQADFIATTTF